MNGSDPLIWLGLYFLIYAALALFWARQAALLNTGSAGFFVANNGLPPWVVALVMTGASLSGWVVLGFPEIIARQGFGFAPLSLAGIFLPLAGVLFFKRQWVLGRRYGLSSQGALFTRYFGGRGLSVMSAGVAVLFAVGFSGMQLRALGSVLTQAVGGSVAGSTFVWAIALLLFAYVVIGGMRAIGYLGALQTVLLGTAMVGLTVLVLWTSGGFGVVIENLARMAQSEAESGTNLFRVAGVIQFTSGIGLENPVGSQWTAVMILSMAMALMGFQASPLATQLVLSSRSATGFAAGQTWVMAGAFGAFLVFGVVLIGAQGLITGDGDIISGQLRAVGVGSPWFMAGLALGLVAAVQVVAGLSLLTAASALVNDIYIPFFHKGLGSALAVLLVRIVIGLLLLTSVLLAVLAPVSLSAIGAVALPVAFQLWPALIGLCWFRWISRQAVTVGAAIGIFAVLATDRLGVNILEFLGLNLPWGRWPWTIQSAAWGMFFNLLAVVAISAIAKGHKLSEQQRQIRTFLRTHVPVRAQGRALKPAAWSAVIAWFFLALGPGVVLGSYAFGNSSNKMDGWLVGIPPVWAWSLLFWVLGVLLIWFLAYRLELATAPAKDISPTENLPHLPLENTGMQEDEIVRLVWFVTVAAGGVTLVTWIFG